MSTIKANTWLSYDGTENFKCKAWVTFNGTGTVTILASGNVSSITDNGTGDYTANITNALADGNYALSGFARSAGTACVTVGQTANGYSQTPSAVDFICGYYSGGTATNLDCSYVSLTIFR